MASSSSFEKPKHIKYWQRCHNTYLPSAYTPNDSTRLTLAFFIVGALDLLSVPLTTKDRSAIRSWVLGLQHPNGGFCGSPTHVLAGQDGSKASANLAATHFALLMLALAADNDAEAKAAFAGVNRRKLLRWLRQLQREDGSFGQVLWDGEAVGGRDMRHSYMASCIRWMIRGDVKEGDSEWEEDVDNDKMVGHIRSTQTYDGGVAEASAHESHAGYAYCAIAALYMLDRPQSSTTSHTSATIDKGVADRDGLVRFLVNRQFQYLAKDEADEQDEESENYIQSKLGDLDLDGSCVHVGIQRPVEQEGRHLLLLVGCRDISSKPYATITVSSVDTSNSVSQMIDSFDALNIPPSRQFLLDITQHQIGGFSKHTGGPPDVYHSYLGLAALSLMGDKDLKEFDFGLCCSKELARKIELARDGLVHGYGKSSSYFDSDGFWDNIK